MTTLDMPLTVAELSPAHTNGYVESAAEKNSLPPAPATPTRVTYAELQQAYDHFNSELFDGKLPSCLITLQREKKTCGYFSAARFAALDGSTTDEIALNPSYFAVVPLIETMQTLVHEMVHLWQHHFGQPGRGRYHNEEWAFKMESIGLMPSSTGAPGGKRTGDCMADYAMEDGHFLQATQRLLTADFKLSWYDRFPSLDHMSAAQTSMAAHVTNGHTSGNTSPIQTHQALANVIRPGQNPATARPGNAETPMANKSNRVKYSCACANVWGKAGLQLVCLLCNAKLEETDA